MFGMKMTSGSRVVAHLRPLLKVVMISTSSQGGGYVLACVKKWRYSDRAPLVGVAGLSGTYTSHVSSNFGVGMIGAVDWQRWAGRGGGGDTYQFGDFSRGVVRAIASAPGSENLCIMCTVSQPKVSQL